MAARASGAGRPTVTVVPPGAVAANAVSKARGCPAASMTTRRAEPGGGELVGEHGLLGAEGAGGRELVGAGVDGDHRVTERPRHQQRGHPDAAEADDHHGVAGGRPRGVQHGAPAGEHRAAEKRGDLGGDVGRYRHDGAS